jgi:hypothetical protein
MRITWKQVTDSVFSNLLLLIEEGRIHPGSIEERKFLEQQSEIGLFNLFAAHGISYYPKVTVDWNMDRPDDLVLQLDKTSIDLLRAKGLL